MNSQVDPTHFTPNGNVTSSVNSKGEKTFQAEIDSSDSACLLANPELQPEDMTMKLSGKTETSINFKPTGLPNEDNPDKKTEDPPSKFRITVEPAVFLTMLAISFSMITSGNLIIDRICRITYNYSREVCNNYTNNDDIKDQVQGDATDYSMYLNLIQSVPPVFFAFFLGAWSDRHGRKLPMILPSIGYLFFNIGTIILCVYDDLPPQYLLIPSVFTGISGGMVSFIMGSFSYVSDVTKPNERTKRIAIVDLFLVLAMSVGLVVSSEIYGHWGFIPIYGCNIGIVILNVLYVIFFIKETKNPSPEERKHVISDLFRIDNVVSNFKVCFRPRENNDRAFLIMVFFATLCFMVPLMGESSIMLLFVQNKFSWTQQQLSTYQAFVIVMTAVGMILIFKYVLPKWKLSDSVLGLLSTFGTVVKSVLFSISFGGWMLYLANLLTFFQPIGLPSLRSFMSKLVDEDEQGKLYALIASGEAIVPIFTSVMYTRVYQATRYDFPGAAFLLSALLMVWPCFTFSWIYYKRRQAGNVIITRADEEEKH